MTSDPFWHGVAVLYWWLVFVPTGVIGLAMAVWMIVRIREDRKFWNPK